MASTSLNEPVAQALEAIEGLPSTEITASARSSGARFRVTRQTAEIVAALGRAGVIFLPVYALLADKFTTTPRLAGVALLITTVWWIAGSAALSTARHTLLALGPTVLTGITTFSGLVAASALTLWMPGLGLGVSPDRLVTIALFAFVLGGAWECLVARSVADTRRVLVLGGGPRAQAVIEQLAHEKDTPFDVVGIVSDDGVNGEGDVPRYPMDDLTEVVCEQRPDIVVLAIGDSESRDEAFTRLLDVAMTGFRVVGLAEFYEHAFGRVPVRQLTATWFMSVLHLYQRTYSRVAKRAFDVLVASFGLLVTAPVMPFIYLLVRRTPGAVIFRQTRLGEGGRHYTMYKFRTMVADAEAQGAMFAADRDPRVTPVGRFLRKTRLDELPQLWNVLKGDMSIVGPRPERPEFYDMLREAVPFWTHRHLVKPGVTGWAQVRSAYAADADSTTEKLSYDLWYLRHRSLVIDLAICLKTFSTLLSGSGAR